MEIKGEGLMTFFKRILAISISPKVIGSHRCPSILPPLIKVDIEVTNLDELGRTGHKGYFPPRKSSKKAK